MFFFPALKETFLINHMEPGPLGSKIFDSVTDLSDMKHFFFIFIVYGFSMDSVSTTPSAFE